MEWALVVEPVSRLDTGELVEGSILRELHVLHDLEKGLSVTELLLGLLGSTVGDTEGTEGVAVASFFGGRR
jgi:hypothetical protein